MSRNSLVNLVKPFLQYDLLFMVKFKRFRKETDLQFSGRFAVLKPCLGASSAALARSATRGPYGKYEKQLVVYLKIRPV